MYTAARFTDDTQNLDTADSMWGFERIDLATGEAESTRYSARSKWCCSPA